MSEYEPLFDRPAATEDDLRPVERRFAAAAEPFLRSPVSWLAWAAILPAAALGTPAALRALGVPGALLTWSIAVLAGGLVELFSLRRGGAGRAVGRLARWVLRAQGNISLVAVALSAALAVRSLALAELLPGMWLLLLGHSLFVLGGLAYKPLRTAGLLYQAGGLAALWPSIDPLIAFAITTAVANGFVGVSLLRDRRAA